MNDTAPNMQIIPGTDAVSAPLANPGTEFLARIDQEEQAERGQVETQIQAAMDKINAALTEDFETARQAFQVRKDKLHALKRKLAEIPEELVSLTLEEERLQAELGLAIEDGKSLAKLTKELSAIRTKKQEVEVMQEILEKKTVPSAEKAFEEAGENLSGHAVKVLSNVLESQRNEIEQTIRHMNMVILGWAYALDDASLKLGLRGIRSRLDQLAFNVKTSAGLPGRPGSPMSRPATQYREEHEERLTDFV